jgi:hypothetical protein|tara:strand:+ start:259 stop:498 length:240 start_codon:yes stop_codon:yes gene_type:complete
MDWLAKISNWIKGITQVSLLLLALGVTWQVLFGSVIPFIGGDIVGNMMVLLKDIGSQGLVGLLTLGILFWLFRHYKDSK